MKSTFTSRYYINRENQWVMIETSINTFGDSVFEAKRKIEIIDLCSGEILKHLPANLWDYKWEQINEQIA